MILERPQAYSIYTPYSMYFRMVICVLLRIEALGHLLHGWRCPFRAEPGWRQIHVGGRADKESPIWLN